MELIGTAAQRLRDRNLRVPLIILSPEHTRNSSEPQPRDSGIGTFEFHSLSCRRNTLGTYRNRNPEIQGSEPSSSTHYPVAGTHLELIGTATQRFRDRNLRVPLIILSPEHTRNSSEPQPRDSGIGTFEFHSLSCRRNTLGTHRNRNPEIQRSEPSSSNHYPTAGTHSEPQPRE